MITIVIYTFTIHMQGKHINMNKWLLKHSSDSDKNALMHIDGNGERNGRPNCEVMCWYLEKRCFWM